MVPRDLYPLSSAEPPFFVGIDLGGTNIKSGVVDNQGQILGYAHLESEVERGPEAGAQRMARAACEATEQAGIALTDAAHVGLVTPGTMDIASGMLLEPPNLPGWSHFRSVTAFLIIRVCRWLTPTMPMPLRTESSGLVAGRLIRVWYYSR